MAHFAKPAEGSWTEAYPHLGTAPVDYNDSIDPQWFDDERSAVFARSWLNVGRVEQLPRVGSYFTKELEVARTSVVIVRGADDTIRAGFHNMSLRTGRAELIRSVYEGVAFNTRWLLHYLERFIGKRCDPIRYIGGGATSSLLSLVGSFCVCLTGAARCGAGCAACLAAWASSAPGTASSVSSSRRGGVSRRSGPSPAACPRRPP